MEFPGKFVPPVIANNDVPIKITGEGLCRPAPEGLHLEGFEQKNLLNSTMLVGLFFLAYAGIIALGFVWKDMPRFVMVLPLVLVIFPFLRNKGDDKLGQRVVLLIPWTHIKKVFVDSEKRVVIRIKKHKQGGKSYKGAFFFVPSGNRNKLEHELQSYMDS